MAVAAENKKSKNEKVDDDKNKEDDPPVPRRKSRRIADAAFLAAEKEKEDNKNEDEESVYWGPEEDEPDEYACEYCGERHDEEYSCGGDLHAKHEKYVQPNGDMAWCACCGSYCHPLPSDADTGDEEICSCCREPEPDDEVNDW